MRRGNYFEIGDRVYSYGTCIRDILPDGQSIGNITKYTRSTSRHQSDAGSHFCRVKVDNVPIGTKDLAGWYATYVGNGGVPVARVEEIELHRKLRLRRDG